MRLHDQILGPPHSPSRCAMSGGRVWSATFAASLTGESADSVDASCECPCRGCQRGECGLSGAPPLTPRQREQAQEATQKRQRKRWATQKVFSEFDMPPERAPISYRFQVDILHCGDPVDTYYTDDQGEADRLVGSGLRDYPEVRVTSRCEVLGEEVLQYQQAE